MARNVESEFLNHIVYESDKLQAITSVSRRVPDILVEIFF